MFPGSIGSLVAHNVVYLVDSAWNRLEQTTSAYDGIEEYGNMLFFEFFQYEVLAELKLLSYLGELCQFFYRVAYVAYKYGLFVFIDGYFG